MTRLGLVLAGAMMLVSASCFGQPEALREGLEQFYLATNGDDWIRNDGWLDPETEPCDWHGVSCVDNGENEQFYSLSLPGNGLSGELNADLIEVLDNLFSEELDLSDNAIGGTLDLIPVAIRYVDLSHNRFVGGLPDPGRGGAILIPFPLSILDLSHNRFEGPIPDSWTTSFLHLQQLDLSGNSLDSELSNAFAAVKAPHAAGLNVADNDFSGPLPIDLMLEDDMVQINLSGNAFSGEIPTSLTSVNNLHPNDYYLGGLDLCWNDLLPAESVELHEWLEQYHAGVRYDLCLGHTRQPIDLSISGSRFEPARSGEGTTMHLLEGDQALLYWFTYTERGRQMWLTGMTSHVDFDKPWLQFNLIRPESVTDSEGEQTFFHRSRGELRYDRMDNGNLGGLQVYDINISHSDYTPQPVGLRVDHMQLTRLNGTRCQDNDDLPHLSGVWHNPDIETDGFVVEILPDRRAVVYWFTWVPNSHRQAWMIGDGVLDENGAIQIDELIRPTGGHLAGDFDPDDIILEDWGSLTISFEDESLAHVHYSSHDERWGNSDYPLERLSVPKLMECPGED